MHKDKHIHFCTWRHHNVYLPYRNQPRSSVRQVFRQFRRVLSQISLPWVPPRSFCISVWCQTFLFAAVRFVLIFNKNCGYNRGQIKISNRQIARRFYNMTHNKEYGRTMNCLKYQNHNIDKILTARCSYRYLLHHLRA